jgi:hypothetical protein
MTTKELQELTEAPAVLAAHATVTPWNDRACCTLDELLLLAMLLGMESPCDRCNESRARCGGLPRGDGDPRP